MNKSYVRKIILLAIAFCLPVPAQAMHALGSRVSGTAMRAARLGTQIAGRAVRPAMQTPQRMFSSFAPIAPARSSAHLGKILAAGGLAGGLTSSICLNKPSKAYTEDEPLDVLQKREKDLGVRIERLKKQEIQLSKSEPGSEKHLKVSKKIRQLQRRDAKLQDRIAFLEQESRSARIQWYAAAFVSLGTAAWYVYCFVADINKQKADHDRKMADYDKQLADLDEQLADEAAVNEARRNARRAGMAAKREAMDAAHQAQMADIARRRAAHQAHMEEMERQRAAAEAAKARNLFSSIPSQWQDTKLVMQERAALIADIKQLSGTTDAQDKRELKRVLMLKWHPDKQVQGSDAAKRYNEYFNACRNNSAVDLDKTLAEMGYKGLGKTN